MSRARSHSDLQAAARVSQGRGSCFPFLLPPLVILLFGAGMLLVAPAAPSTVLAQAPASSEASNVSSVFTPQVRYWGASIQRWANDSGLDPNLLATVIQIESCGNPYAISNAGALGLFQVMPYHFLAGDDPYAPDTNALRGSAYLARSLSAAGNDVPLALAGYNGGIGVISRSEWFWPAETTRYVYWGGGIYADAAAGLSTSARLDEWLAAGGASMCSRARQVLRL